eukprot:scaffold4225_cov128-Cylindrotheca_fusiformis.AAC.8
MSPARQAFVLVESYSFYGMGHYCKQQPVSMQDYTYHMLKCSPGKNGRPRCILVDACRCCTL